LGYFFLARRTEKPQTPFEKSKSRDFLGSEGREMEGVYTCQFAALRHNAEKPSGRGIGGTGETPAKKHFAVKGKLK
jgi:hypothetical protein